MTARRRITIILLAAAVIAGGWFYYSKRNSRHKDVLPASGNIEANEVELSFRIAGWVKQRPVDEGDAVKVDQLIAQLDPTELSQQVAQSAADVEAAKALLDELVTGSRPQEIITAQAAVSRAKADADFRKLDLDRVKSLFERGVATRQELDTADTAFKAADAALVQAQENLKLVNEGPRIERIQQARARLNQSKAALDIAKTQLSYTKIFSPANGVVLSENVEPGEFVSAGTPIVTVADITSVYLRVYISETDLGRIHLGQTAYVRTDTFPGKVYEGKLVFISSQAEFTPKNVQTQKERVKLVYRVKIDINNPETELKPGMPADAEISLR